MYKCKHFSIEELVNPTLLRQIGVTVAWSVFDDRLLKCADLIRDKYGPCTVNTGSLIDCGLRSQSSTTGAKYSMHKIGRALDLHIVAIEKKYGADKVKKTLEYNKVRQELLKLPEFNVLNFETNISWLHIDTGNRKKRTFNQ